MYSCSNLCFFLEWVSHRRVLPNGLSWQKWSQEIQASCFPYFRPSRHTWRLASTSPHRCSEWAFDLGQVHVPVTNSFILVWMYSAFINTWPSQDLTCLSDQRTPHMATSYTVSNFKATCSFWCKVSLSFFIQKRQLGVALVAWVRKVLSDEFEMLHSSFPRREGLLELARLENFLRYTSPLYFLVKTWPSSPRTKRPNWDSLNFLYNNTINGLDHHSSYR